MRNLDDLEEKLRKYKEFLDEKVKKLKALEENMTIDIDTKLKKMIEIINEDTK
ncbi:MAG: hypothetical protein QXL01_00565 [Thermoplasmatales archaeon]